MIAIPIVVSSILALDPQPLRDEPAATTLEWRQAPGERDLGLRFALVRPPASEDHAVPVVVVLLPAESDAAAAERALSPGLAAAAAARGFVLVVLALDPAAETSFASAEAAVPALLDLIASEVLVEEGRPFVLGAAAGGAAARAIAARFPDRFRGMVVDAAEPLDAMDALETLRIEGVLDALHAAAAAADGARYFDLFTEDAVFLGTDATERWTLPEFRAFAAPYFEQGKGWTYVPRQRHVRVAGEIAWFDERLDNEHYGETRGSGVLRRDGGRWRVAHYVLSFAVPNDKAKRVVEVIRGEG